MPADARNGVPVLPILVPVVYDTDIDASKTPEPQGHETRTMVETRTFVFSTQAEMDVVDVTKDVADRLAESSISNGIVTVFVPGSTGALTTMEYEPGLVSDMKEAFEKIAPRDHYYHHEERWHDKNGHSHVRAALVGPSVTIPFRDKRLLLGTWQQIVFMDFDVRARERELFVQIVGD